jgi:hypothetical protein
MAQPDPVRAALICLQERLRDDAVEVSPADAVLNFAVPEDLVEAGPESLYLGSVEAEAFRTAKSSIAADLRFEHLTRRVASDPLQEALVRFACLCEMKRDTDQVAPFFSGYSREPEERVCFIGIEYLQVTETFEFFGLRLLPTDHADVPDADGLFTVEPPIGAVAAVPTEGTHLGLMKDRATAVAERVLRVLRVGLRENRYLNPLQLRFRLAESYSFGGRAAGFQTPDDARWDVKVDRELIDLVEDQSLAALATEPENDLEQCAARALSWIEASMIEGDRLKSLLFLFFALEAMLGERSEGLKGHGLAFRRALLSLATRGHFADPERASLLYDQVRSAAVHGGEPPNVPEDMHRAFAWDMRIALVQYMELAMREGFATRRALLRYLRQLEDREKLAEWLRERDRANWDKFLNNRPRGSLLIRATRFIDPRLIVRRVWDAVRLKVKERSVGKQESA